MEKSKSVTESIEMTMSLLVMYWKRFFENAMEKYSIRTVAMGAVLYSAYLHEGIVQDELGRILNMDKAYITRELNKLSELGYIVRDKDENDRRKNHIIVTEKGKKVAEAIGQCREEWITAELSGITEGEQEVFLQILTKMVGNIQANFFGDEG